jgi:hypothetical protein
LTVSNYRGASISTTQGAAMASRNRAKEFTAWRNAKRRCLNPKHDSFSHYGGSDKPVEFCAKWLDFRNFLSDMGECPPGCRLVRKDKTKGYLKENCAWDL